MKAFKNSEMKKRPCTMSLIFSERKLRPLINLGFLGFFFCQQIYASLKLRTIKRKIKYSITLLIFQFLRQPKLNEKKRRSKTICTSSKACLLTFYVSLSVCFYNLNSSPKLKQKQKKLIRDSTTEK